MTEKENEELSKESEKLEETEEETMKSEAAEEENDTASEEKKEEKNDSDKKQKKQKQKNKKPDKRDEMIVDLTDRLKRSLAEFDNFRKRSEKEKSQMFDIGAKSVIEAILPVVDNFERGLAAIDKETLENDPFAQGMEKTYKQLLKTLEDIGVKEIEAKGSEFNPDFHNAVMHEDNDEYGENIVSEVLMKGYTYHDSVVRHSMVKVAN